MTILEKVAASSFSSRSSLRNLIIVSVTIVFSLSYFALRFPKAFSAANLFALRTLRKVEFCSVLASTSERYSQICFCISSTDNDMLSGASSTFPKAAKAANTQFKPKTRVRRRIPSF